MPPRAARKAAVPPAAQEDATLGKRVREPSTEPEKPTKSAVIDEAPGKIVTMKVEEGKVPVDMYAPGKDNYEVHVSSGIPYACTLSKSDVGKNNNKFYIVQLLENKKTKQLSLFTRWGRIGVPGQQGWDNYSNIGSYNSKKRDKLGGGYKELKIDYDDSKAKSGDDADKKLMESASTTLGIEVCEIIKSLFSIKNFTNQVKEIGFDVKRMPLGKLSQEAIDEGLECIKEIATIVKAKRRDNAKLGKLVSRFFTAIPHDIGFQQLTTSLLDTEEKVQQKIELLDMLSNFQLTKKAIEANSNAANPLEQHYKGLNTEIKTLDQATEEAQLILKFATNGIAPMHQGLKIKVDTIFKLHKPTEDETFKKDLENKTLLFHGQKMTNFATILTHGLQMPAADAPSTGLVFGKGIYHTDCFSKAVINSFFQLSGNICYILVNEVALGTINRTLVSDYAATGVKEGTNSTLGAGRLGVNPANATTTPEGIAVPMGPVKETTDKTSQLQFDEYVVYDPTQIRMRYLLRCTAGK